MSEPVRCEEAVKRAYQEGRRVGYRDGLRTLLHRMAQTADSLMHQMNEREAKESAKR